MNRPTKINFESSTSCNARCTFCPHLTMTRILGEMSDELFHKIIKDGKDMGVHQFSPFFMGEPFIFPRIWDWLDYMEKEEVKVALYTNGVHVDVDRVVKYKNISLLSFSVNSATEETHQKVMHLSNFAVVKENYEEARKKARFPVRTTFVITKDNVHEVELYKKVFDKTATTGFSNWTGDKHDALERKGERVPCWVIFRQMMILWDGRVVPCCSDYDGKQIMGDANKQTLKEIWESSSWLREKHKRCEFDTPVCENCNYNVENKYA